ncbi:hypothetical protein [Methylorubrum extorquens]
MRALEDKVQRLENDKLLLREKIKNSTTPPGDFERRLRTELDFVSSPWKLWKTGQIEDCRAVLKLTFAHSLCYERGEGFRTHIMTLPFKVLGDFFSGEMGMARPNGGLGHAIFCLYVSSLGPT